MDVMALRRVVETLPRFAYRFASEGQLHEGVATVLREAKLQFEHEVAASPSVRFDFLVEPGIVIELKTKGSLSEALSQVGRYAALPQVQAVVLASTRYWAAQVSDLELHGKPVRVLHLRSAAF